MMLTTNQLADLRKRAHAVRRARQAAIAAENETAALVAWGPAINAAPDDALFDLLDAFGDRAQDLDQLPPVLTSEQVADVLQVSDRTASNMCSDGRLKAIKIGERWRVERSELKRFLATPG